MRNVKQYFMHCNKGKRKKGLRRRGELIKY
jgi:hypothetical protein